MIADSPMSVSADRPATMHTDAERLDWLQNRVDGTGETLSFGGVCYWGLEIQKSRYGKLTRIGEGGDLREAIDDAMDKETPDV